MNILEHIKAEALRLGFLLTGSAPAQSPPHYPAFMHWVQQDRHAGMAYLAAQRSLERRSHPAQILPGCRTLITVALPYPPPEPISPRIAAYARGADYHDLIPPRLDRLAQEIARITAADVSALAYTDTGAILERDFASLAGLGWIGKNTCLIHPKFGSFFVLGELLLDTALESDKPFAADRCGSCKRCVEACPTACILPDRTIDACRCISYLTIENKGAVPRELRSAMGDWLFGCDICQLVCPWNQKPQPINFLAELQPRYSPAQIQPEELFTLSTGEFKLRFAGSPLLRARRRGLLRNAAIVLGNRRDPGSMPLLARVLSDEPEALVRAHAAWALGQISGRKARQILQDRLPAEADPHVAEEICAALENAG